MLLRVLLCLIANLVLFSHQIVLGDCQSPKSGPPGVTGPTGPMGPQGPTGSGSGAEPTYLSYYRFIDLQNPQLGIQPLTLDTTTSIIFDTPAVPPLGITVLNTTQFQVESGGIYLIGWNMTFNADSEYEGPVDPPVIIDISFQWLLPNPINSAAVDFIIDGFSVSGQALFMLSANDIVELQVNPHGGPIDQLQLICYLNSIFILKIADLTPP